MIFNFFSQNYGISSSISSQNFKIGYLNGMKMRQGEMIFPSDGTAMENLKELIIKKIYSEFLERFRLGVGGYTSDNQFITYGSNKEYGYIDTTGTATGMKSEDILLKATREIIEKNELFNFWYTNRGERYWINITESMEEYIKQFSFIGNSYIIIAMQSLSNYYTVISMTFDSDKILTGCGISCDETIELGMKNAIKENKVIEWQHYMNPKSKFYKNCIQKKSSIYGYVSKKMEICGTYVYSESEKKGKRLMINKSIPILESVILGSGKGNITSIKLISKYLLNCIPQKKYLYQSMNQGILQGTEWEKHNLDCILV